MQSPSSEDIALFDDGHFEQFEHIQEEEFDGRHGSYRRLPLNSPAWVAKAKDLGLIECDGGNDPKPTACPHCDFSSGWRGGDRCGKCGGTGSVLRAGALVFPNTKDGYEAAQKAANS